MFAQSAEPKLKHENKVIAGIPQETNDNPAWDIEGLITLDKIS